MNLDKFFTHSKRQIRGLRHSLGQLGGRGAQAVLDMGSHTHHMLEHFRREQVLVRLAANIQDRTAMRRCYMTKSVLWD